MELESDLAKELFDKVILPIQAKNIDSKQDNTEQEKKHREALLRLNKRHQRDIKEKQKEMKKTQELEKRRQELEDLNKITQSEPVLPEPPAPDSEPPAIETPAIQALPAPPAIQTPDIQALPAPPALPSPPSPTLPEIETPTIQTPTLPALPPPAIKVNKEELLSENNIDNLLTILRKTLSQKQDETENITEQDDNALVITPSDDNKLIEPVNNNSEVETVVRTQSSAPAPEPAPAPVIVTSCDDEDCQEPINTSQSQQVSPEQDISLTPPDLSEEESITNLTQKIPELNIGDKMSWITQALAALFSTIGNLFTFEPVQDNDPYVNEEKEREGYVYVGKMYMKPEDETKRPEKVKYINYNPTEKDFYIDEREEVKE